MSLDAAGNAIRARAMTLQSIALQVFGCDRFAGEGSGETACTMSLQAAQRQRAIHLYRHGLKNLLSWAIRRDLFAQEAARLRAEFDLNKEMDNVAQAGRLIEKGEAKLKEYQHPDPYIVPYHPGGSLYARNPPFPRELKQQLDFGREGH
ncbi:g10353 [Coccomyxa elongata]